MRIDGLLYEDGKMLKHGAEVYMALTLRLLMPYIYIYIYIYI